MQAALALVPLIIQLLPTITVGAEKLVAWIQQIRSAAQQTGEWTDDLEKQYQASLILTASDPAYKPR